MKEIAPPMWRKRSVGEGRGKERGGLTVGKETILREKEDEVAKGKEMKRRKREGKKREKGRKGKRAHP
jgi:hypothetical protein